MAMERRAFLVGMASAAIFPSAAFARVAPTKPFVLERVLRRGLSDRQDITVTRRWDIRFAAGDGGALSITGAQSFAQVDAPEALRMLANLEAKRDEAGFLPLDLDAQGIITDGSAPSLAPLPEDVVDAAIAYASSQAADQQSEAASRRFIAELSTKSAGWLSMLPRDLFFPEPRDRTVERAITLPDGASGTVEMREQARAGDQFGMLDTFLREVATTTGRTTRKSSETWTLTSPVP